MNERRKTERRSWGPPPEYPFVDSNGNLVTHNRRRTVDRRLLEEDDDTAPTPTDPGGVKQLRLSLNGTTKALSEGSEQLLAGRGSGCDLRLHTRFASREHVRFECRDGTFLIIDQSTNGTYLIPAEGQEIHLRGEAFTLRGSGQISLGTPVDYNDREIIHYACP
jgi:hypothetical protein